MEDSGAPPILKPPATTQPSGGFCVLHYIRKHIASILGFWKKKLEKKNKDDDFAK